MIALSLRPSHTNLCPPLFLSTVKAGRTTLNPPDATSATPYLTRSGKWRSMRLDVVRVIADAISASSAPGSRADRKDSHERTTSSTPRSSPRLSSAVNLSRFMNDDEMGARASPILRCVGTAVRLLMRSSPP
ncbi:hypothetical protein DIPPA_03689 [Diplonema papillatum]|nr:hypothetical protein DIPPA_03689 [Diplonema papillatum]